MANKYLLTYLLRVPCGIGEQFLGLIIVHVNYAGITSMDRLVTIPPGFCKLFFAPGALIYIQMPNTILKTSKIT